MNQFQLEPDIDQTLGPGTAAVKVLIPCPFRASQLLRPPNLATRRHAGHASGPQILPVGDVLGRVTCSIQHMHQTLAEADDACKT